jgi:tRNA (cytidine/uridine-2'-O-)-methyltransferase
LIEHESIEAYLDSIDEQTPLALLSKKAGPTHFQLAPVKGMHFIFGKESAGIPDWLIQKYAQRTFRIPMIDPRVRSLNLSNAVSIVAYEALGTFQNLRA